jgi:hypothetical protein
MKFLTLCSLHALHGDNLTVCALSGAAAAAAADMSLSNYDVSALRTIFDFLQV